MKIDRARLNTNFAFFLIAIVICLLTYYLYLTGRALLFLLPVFCFTGAMLFVKRSENLSLILLILGPTPLYFDAIQIDLRSFIFLIVLVVGPLTLVNQNQDYRSGVVSISRLHILQKLIPKSIFIFGLINLFLKFEIDEISLACLSFPLLFRLLIIAQKNLGILKLVVFLVTGISLSIIISLFQFLGLIPKLPGARDNLVVNISDYGQSLIRFSGSVGDYELLGWSIAVGFALTFGLMLYYKRSSTFTFAILFGNLTLFGICGVLTGNRATLAEISFAIIFQVLISDISSSRKIFYTFIFSVSTILIIYQLDSKYLYFRRSLSNRGEFSATNLLSSRLTTWKQAVSEIPSSILLGSDTGGYRVSSPHNFILWALISAGILGTISIVIVLISLFFAALNLISHRNVITNSLSCALFITLFDNMLVEPVRFVSVFTLWLLLVAICSICVIPRSNPSVSAMEF